MKLLLPALLFLLTSCTVNPKGLYSEQTRPTAPDYAKSAYWAALPDRDDAADLLPTADLKDVQDDAPIDVFYLYPTLYSGQKGEDRWNAPVDDRNFLNKVDSMAIKNHATVFNGVGKVYAPYYRQAHLSSYGALEKEKTKASAEKAFELAYQDVKAAFLYFLENYNADRPFIIASHSQGTTHAKKLLREVVDGQKVQDRMIAAYLIGIEVKNDYFQNIPVCSTPEMTGCFCTWRTWKAGNTPKAYVPNNDIAVVNPLSWTTAGDLIPRSEHKGAVLYEYHEILPNLVDARAFDGYLYTTKPKFKGSIFFIRKNYHIADINLFWLDIRENARYRVSSYQNSIFGD